MWRILILVLPLLLLGCQADLFSHIDEIDANQIVAALQDAGIDATKKTTDSGKTWNVTVDEKQFSQAMDILQARGLPQEKHATLGEVFKRDGLISTPTEERIRFIYAVSQELSATISQIDGVISARVLVVLPNNDPLAAVVKPSSASVFVKYRPDADVKTLLPAIKDLVIRGVEGLSYDNVSVTMVPADPAHFATRHRVDTGSDWVQWSSIAVGVLALIAVALFGISWNRVVEKFPFLRKHE